MPSLLLALSNIMHACIQEDRELCTVQGNILDDEELINTLAQSKITSNEISAKVAEAEVTEKQIDETRELYRPVTVQASLLSSAENIALLNAQVALEAAHTAPK
eukprot:286699-Pelagomonas_calceolata.AAC.1